MMTEAAPCLSAQAATPPYPTRPRAI